MTQQQKLERLIRESISSGWQYGGGIGWADAETVLTMYHIIDDYEQRGDLNNFKLFLFDHDFIKALFGNEEVCSETGNPPMRLEHDEFIGSCDCFVSDEWGNCNTEEKWEYNVKQAVTSDDPIGYMYLQVFGGYKVISNATEKEQSIK